MFVQTKEGISTIFGTKTPDYGGKIEEHPRIIWENFQICLFSLSFLTKQVMFSVQ